jgi:hypothetical protein
MSTVPTHLSGVNPATDSESIADFWSIMRKTSATAAAFVMVIIWGLIWVREMAATITAKMTLQTKRKMGQVNANHGPNKK